MRILIVSAVVLALIVAVYGGRMLWLISISKGLVEASRSFERVNGGQPRILVVGDSTGVGTGVSDPRGSVAGRFGTDYPNAEIVNISVNGWRVANALEHFPSTTPNHYDLVLLQIGANDIIQRTSMNDFTRDLSSLFDRATSAGTHVVALHSGNVGLAPLFAWPLSVYLRAKTLEYRAEYRRIADDKGVLYVDMFKERRDDPFAKDKASFYAPDQLHLTEKGYGNWYDNIWGAMKNAGIAL